MLLCFLPINFLSHHATLSLAIRPMRYPFTLLPIDHCATHQFPGL